MTNNITTLRKWWLGKSVFARISKLPGKYAEPFMDRKAKKIKTNIFNEFGPIFRYLETYISIFTRIVLLNKCDMRKDLEITDNI